nr:hypothetical protein CFP56_13349 [Quercus suber]
MLGDLAPESRCCRMLIVAFVDHGHGGSPVHISCRGDLMLFLFRLVGGMNIVSSAELELLRYFDPRFTRRENLPFLLSRLSSKFRYIQKDDLRRAGFQLRARSLGIARHDLLTNCPARGNRKIGRSARRLVSAKLRKVWKSTFCSTVGGIGQRAESFSCNGFQVNIDATRVWNGTELATRDDGFYLYYKLPL